MRSIRFSKKDMRERFANYKDMREHFANYINFQEGYLLFVTPFVTPFFEKVREGLESTK